jgi:hypothetical protein
MLHTHTYTRRSYSLTLRGGGGPNDGALVSGHIINIWPDEHKETTVTILIYEYFANLGTGLTTFPRVLDDKSARVCVMYEDKFLVN